MPAGVMVLASTAARRLPSAVEGHWKQETGVLCYAPLAVRRAVRAGGAIVRNGAHSITTLEGDLCCLSGSWQWVRYTGRCRRRGGPTETRRGPAVPVCTRAAARVRALCSCTLRGGRGDHRQCAWLPAGPPSRPQTDRTDVPFDTVQKGGPFSVFAFWRKNSRRHTCHFPCAPLTSFDDRPWACRMPFFCTLEAIFPTPGPSTTVDPSGDPRDPPFSSVSGPPLPRPITSGAPPAPPTTWTVAAGATRRPRPTLGRPRPATRAREPRRPARPAGRGARASPDQRPAGEGGGPRG